MRSRHKQTRVHVSMGTDDEQMSHRPVKLARNASLRRVRIEITVLMEMPFFIVIHRGSPLLRN
jgi:hypothetical protein